MPRTVRHTVAARGAGLVLLFLMALFSVAAHADSADEIRLMVGSRLFPSMLAADMDLAGKVASDNTLRTLVVYRVDRHSARRAADELAQIPSVRSIPLTVVIVSIDDLPTYKDRAVAGIFIAERLDERLVEVISFARKQHIITFSPFQGDVEAGVVGGILVRDRILPFINKSALRDSTLSLRSFYFTIAETYEPK